jgi:hypothetical protein
VSPTGCVGRGVERVEGRVESLLAPPVGFVVGLGGHRTDQFFEVGVGEGQMKTAAACSDGKYCSLAIDVEK